MNRIKEHEHGRYRPIDFGRPKPDDNWPYHNFPKTPNNPEFGDKNPKFERHLFIRRDQIFFDIDSQLGMIADSRRKQDGSEDETITNATTKYQKMFYRWIDSHIGETKTIMSAFILEKFLEVAMNSIKDKEEVDIVLLVPEWYDDTTFQELCDKVHEYIATATMADFCYRRFTSKDALTTDFLEQKTLSKEEVRKLVNMSKPGRISKPFKPF